MSAATRSAAAALAVAALAADAFCAPRLKPQAEVIADGELKAKVLVSSRGIPPATPEARTGWVSRGGVRKDFKVYNPADIWRARAEMGTWKDKAGNVMTVARVKSLVPSDIPEFECTKEAVNVALDELESSFKGTAEELEDWKAAWGGSGTGRFASLKGSHYWVEFTFAEKVAEKDAEKLFKDFERSMSALTKSSSGAVKSMQWWEMTDGKYRFLTNLDKAKGTKFIKDSMRMMAAMRKAFEFYVPPKKEPPVSTVRVFKTLAEYREYRASTGDNDTMSCGLWDPGREELLIVAENPKAALETMRHESFHQYLHYATGRGDNADWFNEGHATIFENVKYNPAKNSVAILDAGNRSEWVARDPAKYARLMPSVLKLSHQEFCSGKVNDHYVTAWAICYFLERGAYASKEFEAYRGVCAKYLEAMARGESAEDATTKAWALVSGRDIGADFLKFWKEKRKAALTAREQQ